MTDTKKRRRKRAPYDIDAPPSVPQNWIPIGPNKTVPIRDVKMYPGNARRGNIDKIVESLSYHGQFAPLLVQKSTRYILKGNHTYMAADRLGWSKVLINEIDVDDEQARKIVLIDNATADDSTYDYDALLSLIQQSPDPLGTGYTQEFTDNLQSILSDIQSGYTANGGDPADESRGKSAFDEDDDIEAEDFDSIPSVMKGVTSLKPDVVFRTEDYWGIPDLEPSMLYERIPDLLMDIKTWSGPTSTQDDGESLYTYSYGTDSTQGMAWDRTIINFFTSDSRFENWWADPAKYTAKLVNAKVQAVISHDFSLFAGTPRVTHLFNIYRSRWLSRYMQEAGIKIIPLISFADLESFEFCLNGIPKEAPVVAIQVQTLEEDKRGLRVHKECIRLAVETLMPEQLIVYGGKPGFDLIDSLDLETEVLQVENRSAGRSRWQKERDALMRNPKLRKQAARVTGVSQTGVAMRGY